MIQPNEIRIGNIMISPESEFSTITQIGYREDMYYARFKDIHAGYYLEDCGSIPLTEDVLLKCGAKLKQSDNNWKYYEIDGFLFDFKIDEQKVWFSAFDRDGMQMSNDFDIEIKYLHQLQNLYFALTNQELEIEL